MTKIKNLNLMETENTISQSNAEQTYSGKAHWSIKKGKIYHECKENECHEIYDILALPSGKTMQFPRNTLRFSENPGIGQDVGKKLFEFCADNTDIEWGMEVCYLPEHDQTLVRIGSSNSADKIKFKLSENTVQFIHSHPNIPGNGEPSDRDLEMAKYNSNNIKYTLYYKGDYRDFTYKGFYEGEYWRSQP